MLRWFTPVPTPDARTSVVILAVLAVLAVLRSTSLSPRTVVAALALGAIGFIVRLQSPAAYLREGAWIGDVFRVVFAIPFLLAWGGLVAALREPQGGDTARAGTLLALLAGSGLLALYPAADFWHLIMAWPAFAPALAWQLERVCRPAGGRVRWQPAAVVTIVLALCATPFVHAVVVARLNRPIDVDVFARASRITDGSAKSRDAAALMRYLEREPADRRLLGVGEGTMLHFLSARRSVLEREEFVLYLVAIGLIEADDARTLIPEQPAIDRLDAAQPIIVVVDSAPSTQRFRSVFRQIAAYIDSHYRTVATFGQYRVMTWSGTA